MPWTESSYILTESSLQKMDTVRYGQVVFYFEHLLLKFKG